MKFSALLVEGDIFPYSGSLGTGFAFSRCTAREACPQMAVRRDYDHECKGERIMYTVNNTAAKWDFLMGKNAGSEAAGTEFFSSTFKSLLQGGSGVDAVMDSLAERFPGVNFSQGRPADGIAGTEAYFGAKKGDSVAVDDNAAAAMASSDTFASRIQQALGDFFGMQMPAMDGAYVQRSVSISVTVVRFTVSQRDAASDEALTTEELRTSLQDKIKELLERMFARKTDDSETEETTETEAAGSEDEAALPNWLARAGAWSVELFMSAGFINGMGGTLAAGQSGFSMSMSGMYGSFSDFGSQSLSAAIYQSLSATGGLGNGPFSSFLNSGLAGFGLTSTGFSMSAQGFSLGATSGKNLLAELMESLFNQRGSGAESDVEDGVGAVEGAAEGSEAAAAVEAAAAP